MYAITYLPLKDIVFSESNPRKEFNPEDLQELSLSISQQGILQPILVRPQGKKYELVCGARRTHAAKLSKLKDVPAIIREMTDVEAFEAQITENLQRKDVHPLEESDAYARLIDKMNLSPVQIAEKLGKSLAYITQRLKLTDLIEPFKDLYLKDVIGLGHALEICKLKLEDQQEFFEDEFEERHGWWTCPTVNRLKQSIFNAFTSSLHNAAWDLEDKELVPEAGACMDCPSNTANSLLFPDLVEPKCLNRKCYNNKGERFKDLLIEKATSGEEEVIFLYNYWDENDKYVKDFKEKGTPAFSTKHYETLERPEQPELDEYEDEADYEEALAEFKDELAQFEEQLSSGTAKKAFLLSRSGNLVESLVIPKEGIPAITGDITEQTQIQKEAEIQTLINDLKAKDRRNKELAFEKVNTKALELMKDIKYLKLQGELSLPEKHGLFVAILSFIGYSAEKELKGIVELSYNRPKNTFQKYDDVVKLSQNPEQQAKILRIFLDNHLKTPSTALGINGQSINYAKAKAFLEISREHFEKEIREVELQEEEKYLKKKANIDARIKDLNSKLSK